MSEIPQTIIVRTQREEDEINERRSQRKSQFIKYSFPLLIKGILLWSLILFISFIIFKNETFILILIISFWIIFPIIFWKMWKYEPSNQRRRVKTNKNTFKKTNDSWERIDRLPNWAYRKMKKRKKNIVNGDNYVYLRKDNKFFRKKK